MKKLGNVLIEVMQDLSRISTNGFARVKVNSHMCDPEEFKTLFTYFTKGTILERIDLEVEQMDPTLECSCGNKQKVNNPEHNGYDRCPQCGQFADIRDEEYQMVEPDPQKTAPRQSIRF